MIAVSMALVALAFAGLLLGVAGVGAEPLRFVYASIGLCLLAAVLLVAGVVRSRPARVSPLASSVREPSWSGAIRTPDPGMQPAGRALPPSAPGPQPEPDPFADALAPLGLDAVRIERLRGRFVSLEALTAATPEQIAEVPGITPDLAQAISQRVGGR